jgi:hypothetical protein
MKQPISTAPVLSPVNGKPVLLNFDGAEMSSDAGLALLREVERAIKSPVLGRERNERGEAVLAIFMVSVTKKPNAIALPPP